MISEGCATQGDSSDVSQGGEERSCFELSFLIHATVMADLHFNSVAYFCVSQAKKSTWLLVLLLFWPTRSNWSHRGRGLGLVAARQNLLPCRSEWRGWRERCPTSGRSVEELGEAAAPQRAKVNSRFYHWNHHLTWPLALTQINQPLINYLVCLQFSYKHRWTRKKGNTA